MVLGTREAAWTTVSDMWAPRMQCVDRHSGCQGGGNLQARLELRFDSGIYWSCPETLWSVLIGAWAYKTPLCFWKAWLSPTYGTSSHLPLWEPQNMGPAAAPNTIELGLSGQGQQWDCWGGQISCQLKQKLLKMVKQLRKNTLPICLASLG